MVLGNAIGAEISLFGYKLVYRPVEDVVWHMVDRDVFYMAERAIWDTFNMIEEWK